MPRPTLWPLLTALLALPACMHFETLDEPLVMKTHARDWRRTRSSTRCRSTASTTATTATTPCSTARTWPATTAATGPA